MGTLGHLLRGPGRRLLSIRHLASSPRLRHADVLSQFKEAPRINQVGIQYLSQDLHLKVFPKVSLHGYMNHPYPKLLDESKFQLDRNGLLGKKTQLLEPINITNFPHLVGENTLDEHFYKIGAHSLEPFLTMCRDFLDKKLPAKPKIWEFQPGWTKYVPGEPPQPVPYPLEDALVFDVETQYRKSPFAVMAVCASEKAWYGWVSPVLLQSQHDTDPSYEHLIPMNCLHNDKLILGYNVSYDRARVLDEYNIKQSQAFYLDGMALHVATSGITSQQRPRWMKHKKNKKRLQDMIKEEGELSSDIEDIGSAPAGMDLTSMEHGFTDDVHDIQEEIDSDLADDPWLTKGSTNSLANVAEFHCGIKLHKETRDKFETLNTSEIIDSFNDLMDYCAMDVDATFAVIKHLFPRYETKIPHPISFAALRHMGTLFLPTTKKWNEYVETAERIYQENREQVSDILKSRAEELIQFAVEQDDSLKPDWENDPWLKQLDWTIKEARLKKDGTPYKKQSFLVGYPNWYRDLFKLVEVSDGTKEKQLNITVRTRITPLLLRLKWEGEPLIWTDSQGWCFKIPYDDNRISDFEAKNYKQARLSEEDLDKFLPELQDQGKSYVMFKVPHPGGPKKRCTSVMSKSYLKYFDSGILSSHYEYAKEILSLNSMASYWMGNRNRIMDQFVIYQDPENKKNLFFQTAEQQALNPEMGIIIPKFVTMGTITRRATENTWLTASNAKSDRIGSELKSLVEAPKGFVFVGADVDSEELWIASLIGDSKYLVHGGCPLGWMTLEGEKSEKTDLHLKTAEILGISRNDAKVFNYGRIYGAGEKFAATLLKQCNPKLSDAEASTMANELYTRTKGTRGRFLYRNDYNKPEIASVYGNESDKSGLLLYYGGTESIVFNALEEIAGNPEPRTPVLGAGITDALSVGNLNSNNSYLTSRINWTIQSSGVDYLHLLIMSMDYLTSLYKVDTRLLITVHDEVRYLAHEKDKFKVALLLQISNLWTRAMFCEQMNITEVPQSVAFFLEVDVDKYLRKDVNAACVTPSHSEGKSPGVSLTILQLLEKCGDGDILKLDDEYVQKFNKKYQDIKYIPRPTVLSSGVANTDMSVRIKRIELEGSEDQDLWRILRRQCLDLMKTVYYDSLESNIVNPKKTLKKPVLSGTKAQKNSTDKKSSKNKMKSMSSTKVSEDKNKETAKEQETHFVTSSLTEYQPDALKMITKPARRVVYQKYKENDSKSVYAKRTTAGMAKKMLPTGFNNHGSAPTSEVSKNTGTKDSIPVKLKRPPMISAMSISAMRRKMKLGVSSFNTVDAEPPAPTAKRRYIPEEPNDDMAPTISLNKVLTEQSHHQTIGHSGRPTRHLA